MKKRRKTGFLDRNDIPILKSAKNNPKNYPEDFVIVDGKKVSRDQFKREETAKKRKNRDKQEKKEMRNRTEKLSKSYAK